MFEILLKLIYTFMTFLSFAFCDELVEAVQEGNLEEINRIMEENRNAVETIPEDGITPLDVAFNKGNMKAAVILMSWGAPLNSLKVEDNMDHPLGSFNKRRLYGTEAVLTGRDECGNTFLHAAVRCKHEQALKYLLSKRVNLNARNDSDHTPLSTAVSVDYVRGIQLLVEAGADVNSKSKLKETALHIAIDDASLEVVEALLSSKKCNFNIETYYGWKPVFSAINRGDRLIMETLLRAGANPNVVERFTKTTALHKAVKFWYREMAEALVKFGANLDAVDDDGKTVLNIAEEIGDYSTMEMLLKNGAKRRPLSKFPFVAYAIDKILIFFRNDSQ